MDDHIDFMVKITDYGKFEIASYKKERSLSASHGDLLDRIFLEFWSDRIVSANLHVEYNSQSFMIGDFIGDEPFVVDEVFRFITAINTCVMDLICQRYNKTKKPVTH